MTSIKQITANRSNAQKSTGPNTPEGKERSRRNAVRHGLTAETIIGDLEDAEDYQAFEASVTADYHAETAVERELVLRLASLLWRLRRASSVESVLFELALNNADKAESQNSDRILVELSGSSDGKQLKVVKTGRNDLVAIDAERDVKAEIGDRFLRLAELPTFPLDRLSRYEHLLWRQVRQTLFTLESVPRRLQPQRSRYSLSSRSRLPNLDEEV